MTLSEQDKIPELEYYHCSKCGCKIDDPNEGETVIGDGIYCGPHHNNCVAAVLFCHFK